MNDKGYAFPLYSLDLIQRPQNEDEARFAVPVPEGYLRLPLTLRRRGASLTSLAMLVAVDDQLDLHQRFLPQLAPVGMSARWGEGARHWQGQLEACYRAHTLLTMDSAATQDRFAGLERECEGAWRDLWLKLRLTGVHLTGVPRVLPRSFAERSVALELAAAALADPRVRDGVARLPSTGTRALAELVGERQSLWEEREGRARERQQNQDRAVTLRGALFGDLQRLSFAARLVLPPRLAGLFSQQPPAPRRGPTAQRRAAP